VGINGLTEIETPGKKNIQIVIPSICYIKSSNNGTGGFANYSVSGGCSTLFNNGYLAFVEITGDAHIIAVSYAGTGG
jgi:hypothetical protein